MKNKAIEKKENKFGVFNVNERLKKIYGQNYGLCITDNNPKGTQIIYTIPYKEAIELEL